MVNIYCICIICFYSVYSLLLNILFPLIIFLVNGQLFLLYYRYAPESLRDGKFSPRSDVWSFGVTMYETFGLGKDPKLPGVGSDVRDKSANEISDSEIGIEEGSAELLAALERGSRLPCPPTCPQQIYVKLMYPCWHLHSHKRPDFASLCRDIRELLNHY